MWLGVDCGMKYGGLQAENNQILHGSGRRETIVSGYLLLMQGLKMIYSHKEPLKSFCGQVLCINFMASTKAWQNIDAFMDIIHISYVKLFNSLSKDLN